MPPPIEASSGAVPQAARDHALTEVQRGATLHVDVAPVTLPALPAELPVRVSNFHVEVSGEFEMYAPPPSTDISEASVFPLMVESVHRPVSIEAGDA